jgi:hypothetical protein
MLTPTFLSVGVSMMIDRTVVARLAALAAIVALALPVEAVAGRGFVGGGAHVGFHRPVAPAFHRPVGPALHRRALRAPIRPAAVAAARHRFGFRHRRGWLDPAVGATGYPYYGAYGPGDNVSADDPAVVDDSSLLRRIPACRAQDYVVPNRRGEPRQVTVTRC